MGISQNNLMFRTKNKESSITAYHKISGDNTTPNCSFNYTLEARLVLPPRHLWANLPGHNTLAMTNNQTTGPLERFSWVFARLPVGDALKFNDIGAARLEPDWNTAVNLYQSIAKLRWNSSISRKLESVNYMLRLGGHSCA